MLITPTNLSFFFTGLETRFWTAYDVAPTFYDKVATTYPVGTEQWVSGWMGMLQKMREWKGSRVVNTPAPQTYLVPMQVFEQTNSIDQFKLEDDTFGVYYPIVTDMGMQSRKWPDYQLRDLLQNTGSQTGPRQNGLDGLTHWNTAHPVNFYDASFGTYCNDFRGGGVSINGVLTGGALGINSFSTLWQEMSARKSESGEPIGLMPDLSQFPSQLKLTADTILQAQFMGQPTVGNLVSNVGATENMLKGWTDRLITAELNANPTTWFMLVTNRPVKPYSWLLRQAPNFVYRNQPQDPVVFDTHTFLYGSMSRGAPAWGFAWLSSISSP